MGRSPRQSAGNMIFHVINRANGRLTIFHKEGDFKAFESILEKAKEKFPIRILCYVIMPNHWHLILQPFHKGDISKFMQWVTLTHTQRWNAHYHKVGYGHVYQGRFKSFPVEKDEYFIQLCRYVERNPLRGRLVQKAEDWQWSSLWRRLNGTDKQKNLLDSWPIPATPDYLDLLKQEEPEGTLKSIRESIAKGKPFGEDSWVRNIAIKLGLSSTLRSQGRPKKILAPQNGV